MFAQSNMRGVTTALLRQGQDPLGNHLVPTNVDNLQLMPSGPLAPNPAELLGSRRMSDLIADLKSQADIVIFDTPPVLPVVDAALLARVCDAAVFVVRASSTRVDALRRGTGQVLQSGTHLLGVVLNRASVAQHHYGYSYYENSHDGRGFRLFGFHLPGSRSRKETMLRQSIDPNIVPDMADVLDTRVPYRNGKILHVDATLTTPSERQQNDSAA
jgi:Mrp family chromosome partitioning ATPase